MVGKTIVRELFDNESPIGQQVRIANRPFTVIGVLSPKGANMMGMDQDDIVLAPWTTIKFKVAGLSATTANQSATAAASTVDPNKVNTLSQIYPNTTGVMGVFPVPSPLQLRQVEEQVPLPHLRRKEEEDQQPVRLRHRARQHNKERRSPVRRPRLPARLHQRLLLPRDPEDRHLRLQVRPHQKHQQLRPRRLLSLRRLRQQ